MNGFAESQLPDKFKTDDYQVLIVAEKYQTGFDEPLLHTMYVDKRLDRVKAVQTLSRLNRICPGKEDTFALDFVNEVAGIQASFKPYYETTEIEQSTDPNLLYDLKSKLDDSQVYWWDDVLAFCKAFFSPPASRSGAVGPAALHRAVDPAVIRFKALGPTNQEEFKSRLESFIRLYAFLSQVISFQDPDLERLYAFGRFLLLKLPRRETGEVDLGLDVKLEYYRLSKTGEQSLSLAGESETLRGPTEVGTGGDQETRKQLLSTVISALNDRFGTQFTIADQLMFDQIEEVLVADESLAQQARVNTIDNYKFGFDSAFLSTIVDRRSQNDGIFTRILDDQDFAETVKSLLIERVYQRQQVAGA
jgi:type I restriction enzyme R subunit